MGNTPCALLDRLRCFSEARRQRSFAASSKPAANDPCDPRQTVLEEIISRKLDALSLFAPPAPAPWEHSSPETIPRRPTTARSPLQVRISHRRSLQLNPRSEGAESQGAPVYRLSDIRREELGVQYKRVQVPGDEDASSDRSRAARAAIVRARTNLTALHTNQPGSKGAVDARRRRHALAMARADTI
ncbi:hypothetical protein T484DRAFT_1744983 [Baffinella frigidus]|nr:hypothetical protein T484DRAFT_1744983 [Cryptophyta sp. CCMP2293]